MRTATVVALASLSALSPALSLPAHADNAVALRVGTPGVGAELDFGLAPSWVARIGYAAFSYSGTVNDTDATYHGKLKLSHASALLDWYPGAHALRLTAGAVGTGTKVDIVGVPAAGTYTIGDQTYSTSEVGSVTGQFKVGSGVAPYLGLGFGNPVGGGHHLTALFDIGVIFTGTPKIALQANCAATAPAQVCAEAQQSVQDEITKLHDKADELKFWPVLNLGLAYRF